MSIVTAFLETGVSVMIPDGIALDSQEAQDQIRAQFRDMIMSQEPVEFNIEADEAEADA